MKFKVIIFLVTVFMLVATGWSGVVVKEFRAEPGLNQVEVKWIVSNELNLKGYNIYRSIDGISFEKRAYIECQYGSQAEKTYIYQDKSVFKSEDRTFYYKLEFVNRDNSLAAFGEVISSSPQISSVRHTWGSIKAMFR